jgi:hypothetical protein
MSMIRWGIAVPLLSALITLLTGCPSNTPPELLPIKPQTAYVGSRFDLRLEAYDPEGDLVTFSCKCPTIESFEKRARIIRVGAQGLFSWTPLAPDVGEHQIDFIANDGENTDI